MIYEEDAPKKMILDEAAPSSDPSLPAFLSRREGSPVYHGFPLVKETMTDGWCFGVITEFENPKGCECGDGFVVAPDGKRAGIVWDVGDDDIRIIVPPNEVRWGVYAVSFPQKVKTVNDLVSNFRHILPELKKLYEELKEDKRS